MSNSSLVNVKIPAYSGNYTTGRSGRKIEAVTIHHTAGILTAEQCGNIFQTPGRNGSSHYGIGNDGRIGQYVDEKNTAWTNSNWDSNCKSVTIETSNCEVGGTWKVSDSALNSLIKLVADIAKRNNLGKLVKGKTLTYHCMFANTSCPGLYLLSKLDYICNEANKINEGETPTPIPTPNEPDYTGTITYQTYTKYWLKEVNKVDNTNEGYAGDRINYISGIRCKPQYGELKIMVHTINGGWLEEISSNNYLVNDMQNGDTYAGIYGQPIDCVKIKTTRGFVDYRVLIKKGKSFIWLDWVRNYKDYTNEYAGLYGYAIYGIQMK